MTRAVAYVRVSTARQELSPEAQVERIRQFAAFSGLELPDDHVVVDVATSGRTQFESRELGRKALALLDGADAIIFAKLSRAFRNAADAMTLVPKLLAAGKDVYFLDFGVSVRTTTGKMIMGMLAVLAEWEVDLISERTVEALDSARKQGKRLGGVPFGSAPAVRVVEGRRVDTGVHVPVPEQQLIVRRIRDLRGQHSVRTIARILNDEKVPSPRGKQWSGETVRRIAERA